MLSKALLPFCLHLFLLLQLSLTATTTSNALPSSPSSQPSNQQEFDDICPDYKTCSQKGLLYSNTLHDTIASPNLRDRTDGLAKFHQYYTATYTLTKPADLDIYNDLHQRGIDADSFDEWTVVSGKTPPKVGDDIPYTNLFSTLDGIIIAESNFRYYDQAKMLEWSELMYQTYLLASARADHESLYGIQPHPRGGPLSNLQSVIQMICVNKATQAVIRTLYAAQGWTVEGEDGYEWKKWTEEEQPWFFFALLGTDNVKGVMYLLNDHVNEVGRKRVKAVWTRWEVFAPDVWVDVG
ncbi:MAG: hypothetical protein Q9220_003881 [cf. Caloplaca sp. 1 TL-2023]